jgi:hypothetical protein
MSTERTKKNERQHQPIKDSSKARGVPKKRAKVVAARTVSKTRRAQGRTASNRTQGTGKPDLILEECSRDELYDMARKRHIPWRCSMGKDQLVKALLGRYY